MVRRRDDGGPKDGGKAAVASGANPSFSAANARVLELLRQYEAHPFRRTFEATTGARVHTGMLEAHLREAHSRAAGEDARAMWEVAAAFEELLRALDFESGCAAVTRVPTASLCGTAWKKPR